MAKDTIAKAIETMLMGTPVEWLKWVERIQKFNKKKAKKDKGKPKGKSPSMILGSASKAGMQSKQGKRVRRPNPPRLGPRPAQVKNKWQTW